jgi:hypothetical protein
MRISTLYKMLDIKCDEVSLLSLRALLAHAMYRRVYTILSLLGRP